MKKSIINLIFIAITMCSCSGPSRSDIEEACNQGDFEKAYRLAGETTPYANTFEYLAFKLFETNYNQEEDDIITEGIRWEYKRFVATRECMYIIENEGENGLDKVAKICSKELISSDADNLLQYAISLGNESLAIKLHEMFGDCFVLTAIVYAITADMEDLALSMIDAAPSRLRLKEYIENEIIANFLKEKDKFDYYRTEGFERFGS